jgi:hypothetical protein
MTIVQLEGSPLPAAVDLEIGIKLRAQIRVTAFTAQRKVSKLVLDRVSNLLCGNEPTLVVADRLRWRVPVWLGFRTTGLVGKVGEIDVDMETGEVLFDQRLLDEIAERADVLARRTLTRTSRNQSGVNRQGYACTNSKDFIG